ncbi:DUF3298 domain-containing protein [uncultured Alistipes sp.]|jgi:hypothetical protein|uniref:RsiV family protein n=1 Tax=uncultured Alistipes sp. TaxID=538949 RepID=UPI0027D95C85|nr:DUF3298 domain-containing protein [uncultured Alistipes sp.]
MKHLKSILLLTGALMIITGCTRKPVVPTFGILAVDTLIGAPNNGCNIGYRFATIDNAAKSKALQNIEKANIEYFFELEEFNGTAQEAMHTVIGQIAENLPLPGNTAQGWDLSEISAESEGALVDTLVTYIITRSNFAGGAHGIYGTECHTYSLSGGYELSTVDLFSEPQLLKMEGLLREKLYRMYGTDSDEGLTEQGFFSEYIALTENFRITADGITFYYNPYEIGCYALGSVEVAMTREELEEL